MTALRAAQIKAFWDSNKQLSTFLQMLSQSLADDIFIFHLKISKEDKRFIETKELISNVIFKSELNSQEYSFKTQVIPNIFLNCNSFMCTQREKR